MVEPTEGVDLSAQVARAPDQILPWVEGVDAQLARRSGHQLTQTQSALGTHRVFAVERLGPHQRAQQLGFKPLLFRRDGRKVPQIQGDRLAR